MSPSVFLFKKCPKALYGKKRENSIHFRVKIIYILEDEIKTAMNWTVCWPVWAICTDISPIHGKTQQD
jgi:hypothetical protein